MNKQQLKKIKIGDKIRFNVYFDDVINGEIIDIKRRYFKKYKILYGITLTGTNNFCNVRLPIQECIKWINGDKIIKKINKTIKP